MNTCDTCIFWKAREAYIYDTEHQCDNMRVTGPPNPFNQIDGGEAGIKSGGFEGYGDYFHPGPKFGCIHHEVKGNEPTR